MSKILKCTQEAFGLIEEAGEMEKSVIREIFTSIALGKGNAVYLYQGDDLEAFTWAMGQWCESRGFTLQGGKDTFIIGGWSWA